MQGPAGVGQISDPDVVAAAYETLAVMQGFKPPLANGRWSHELYEGALIVRNDGKRHSVKITDVDQRVCLALVEMSADPIVLLTGKALRPDEIIAIIDRFMGMVNEDYPALEQLLA